MFSGGANRSVALAWEQGSNYGHLVRQREILRILQTQGFQTYWALSENLAGQYAESLKSTVCMKIVVRSPARTTGFRISSRAISFASVLATQGWTDSGWLTTALRPWLTLLRSVRPQFLVLDYAPVAQLAAYFLGIPALHISSGFDAPPAHCPLFDAQSMAGDTTHEARTKTSIERCIRQAASANSISCSDCSLAGVLAAPLTLLDCLPETDPYGRRDDATYAPFFAGPANATRAHWPSSTTGSPGIKAFLYVRDHRIAKKILDSLVARRIETLCVWPGYEVSEHGQFDSSVRIYPQAIDLNFALQNASILISYGSAGVTSLGVLRGVPQLIIPTDVEKKMIATRISEQRLGLMVAATFEESELEKSLDSIIFGVEHKINCTQLQARYAQSDSLNDFGKTVISKIWAMFPAGT